MSKCDAWLETKMIGLSNGIFSTPFCFTLTPATANNTGANKTLPTITGASLVKKNGIKKGVISIKKADQIAIKINRSIDNIAANITTQNRQLLAIIFYFSSNTNNSTMKQLFIFLFISSILFSCQTSEDKSMIKEVAEDLTEVKTDNIDIGFDSIKAYEYGADEYGMHQYVMAFLKKGPNRDRDSVEAYELLMAHMDNIGKMADSGKLVLAGPFLGDDDLRGIYIFNVKTIEEAKALTETDPAIQAGSLVMELYPWYGSAALVGLNKEHKKVAKENI